MALDSGFGSFFPLLFGLAGFGREGTGLLDCGIGWEKHSSVVCTGYSGQNPSS